MPIVAASETPATELLRALEDFFSEKPQAVVLEDGHAIFANGVGALLTICGAGPLPARIPWLNALIAKWELYEFDEREEELTRIGNLSVRLAHAFDSRAALERSHRAVARVLALLDPALREATEIRANGPTEVSMALHGLEFARIRQSYSANSFSLPDEITLERARTKPS